MNGFKKSSFFMGFHEKGAIYKSSQMLFWVEPSEFTLDAVGPWSLSEQEDPRVRLYCDNY